MFLVLIGEQGRDIFSTIEWDKKVNAQGNQVEEDYTTVKKLFKRFEEYCLLKKYLKVERRLKRWYKKELGKTSDYGILAWGSANKINLKTIERTMNKAIRLIGFKRKYDSVK